MALAKRDEAFSNFTQLIAKLESIVTGANPTEYKIYHVMGQLSTVGDECKVAHLELFSITRNEERPAEAANQHNIIKQALLDVK